MNTIEILVLKSWILHPCMNLFHNETLYTENSHNLFTENIVIWRKFIIFTVFCVFWQFCEVCRTWNANFWILSVNQFHGKLLKMKYFFNCNWLAMSRRANFKAFSYKFSFKFWLFSAKTKNIFCQNHFNYRTCINLTSNSRKIWQYCPKNNIAWQQIFGIDLFFDASRAESNKQKRLKRAKRKTREREDCAADFVSQAILLVEYECSVTNFYYNFTKNNEIQCVKVRKSGKKCNFLNGSFWNQNLSNCVF